MSAASSFRIYSVISFLLVLIASASSSHAKDPQKIPDTFTKGKWVLTGSTAEENSICAGKISESDLTRIYKFNAKTNSFKIGGYEDTTNVKILSFSEVTPTRIKGKAKYTLEYEGEVEVTTRNFEFTIKNNRLYSSTEFAEYHDRAKKYGLRHCAK